MTDAEDRQEREDLRRIGRDALGIGDLDSSVRELVGEVKGLRTDITEHPRLDEVRGYIAGVLADQERLERRTVQRGRKSVFFIALAILFAVQGHDRHIDRCGAGSGLSTAARQATVQRVAEKGDAYNFVCDAATPFHTHNGESFPSGGNVAGWFVYGSLAAGGWVWVRRARPA